MRDREQMHTPSARCRESLGMEFGLDVRPHELLVALAALELTYLNSIKIHLYFSTCDYDKRDH